jgi:hypothetical protein
MRDSRVNSVDLNGYDWMIDCTHILRDNDFPFGAGSSFDPFWTKCFGCDLSAQREKARQVDMRSSPTAQGRK